MWPNGYIMLRRSSWCVLDNLNSIGNNSPRFTGVVYLNRGAQDQFRVSTDGYRPGVVGGEWGRRGGSSRANPVSSFIPRPRRKTATLTAIETRSVRNFTFFPLTAYYIILWDQPGSSERYLLSIRSFREKNKIVSGTINQKTVLRRYT